MKNTPWPMYRHDPQLTGRSPYIGPTIGKINDTIRLRGICESGITIDSDSLIFFPVSGDTINFAAWNNADGILWFLKYGLSEAMNAPSLTENGDIIHISRNGIRRISPVGNIIWQYTPPNQTDGLVAQIDKSGNIYSMSFNGTLQKISSYGEFIWSKTDSRFFWGSGATPSFSVDGEVLYAQGLTDASLLAIDIHAGTVLWSFGSTTLGSAPVVDSYNSIFFHVDNGPQLKTGTMYSLNEYGELRWSYTFGYQLSVPKFYELDPTIDAEGNVYFAIDTLFSFTNDGQLRWKQHLTSLGWNVTPLVCDNDGNIYFGTSSGSTNGNIVCYSSDGVQRWTIPISNTQLGYPSLSNGMLYFTTNDHDIYVVE
ncbi:MAG: outer membrane protein assembly factor BamB family protein [Bacteroidota bacterium]